MASENKDVYLECEKEWIFITLMFVGGFYGAFTYSIRGGVFCNAQTANFVLFAMAAGKQHWTEAVYYFIPMSAYLLGAIVSEAVPKPMKKKFSIRWDTLLILIEMIVVVILGLLPESAPFQISQVAINFICSMQYNTFRQAEGIPMATTFCTNHLRQTGVMLVKSVKSHGDKRNVLRMFNHFNMLFVFVLGGILSTVLCKYFLGKAIWFALLPLTVVLAALLHADLKKERELMDIKPHGH